MLQPAAMFEPPETAVTACAVDQFSVVLSSTCNAPKLIDDARIPPPESAIPCPAVPAGAAVRTLWMPAADWGTSSAAVVATSSCVSCANAGSAHEAMRTHRGVDH